MGRWYMAVALDSFHTKTSGDTLSAGEWYLKVHGHRFPSHGHITMRANETFTAPDPKPLLFSTITEATKEPIVVNIEIKEQDPIKDDLMLEGQVTIFFEEQKKIVELKSADHKVTAKLILIAVKNDQW